MFKDRFEEPRIAAAKEPDVPCRNLGPGHVSNTPKTENIPFKADQPPVICYPEMTARV